MLPYEDIIQLEVLFICNGKFVLFQYVKPHTQEPRNQEINICMHVARYLKLKLGGDPI